MAIKQETRRCKVTSPLGENALILTSLDARERVSALFQIDAQFVSGDDQLDFGKIIGQSITFELEIAGGDNRHWNGRVARFSQHEGATYHAQIVPWFWLLTRRSDCRIFQGQSVKQILEKVFGEHALIADFKFDFEGDYPPIPYCVQYRETDFNFASRLMEEWGIGYYFEHAEKSHKMVLFNAPSKILACPGQPEATMASAAEQQTAGKVLDWQVAQEFRSGACALTDYNYRDPGLDLGVQKKTRKSVGGNEAFEIFDFPGEYQALAAGGARAELRIEAEECAANASTGSSSCHGFTAGHKFDLKGHARASYNTTYLLTEVHHSLSQSVGAGGGGKAGSEYRNSFVCVPHAIPFRPLRVTPKPLIQGAQTATVVGEVGKEIDIDDLGCVFVKFHWDRHAKGDETSSCRIRVSEAWAGKEWGSFFAPRIGQEVIVEFLEGDPDRPIVTGRVYNGAMTPPYVDGNRSGIKSRSTMKGEAKNFNEIRFDDTKGKEEIYIHSERAMTIKSEGSQSQSVGGGQTISVGGDQKTTVKKNASLEVTEGDYKVDTKVGGITLTAMKTLKLVCGGSSIEMTPTMITIKSPLVKIN
jgi:type VI secretion system secreted protein VgrG